MMEDYTISRNFKSIKSESSAINFILGFFKLLEEKERVGISLRLHGIVRRAIPRADSHTSRIMPSSSRHADDYQRDEETKTGDWNDNLPSLMAEAVKKFPYSTKIKYIQAVVLYYKMSNKWSAYYSINDIRKFKPSSSLQFGMYRIEKLIEKELQEAEHRLAENDIDVFKIFEFKNAYSNFQIDMDKAVRLQLDFWSELIDENPDIQKLISIASILTKQFEDLETLFNVLCTYEVSSPEYLKLYCLFLKQIIHDEFETKRVQEKLELMQTSRGGLHDTHDERNEVVDETASGLIITISGNRDSLGKVLSVGNEVTSLLKYKPGELIGDRIELIQPEFYAKNHNKYILRYIESGIPRLIGKNRFLFARDKKGYIIGINAFVKVLPDLSDGLKFVAHIKEFDNLKNSKIPDQASKNYVSHSIIINSHTGKVQGISESLERSFGLKASFFELHPDHAPKIQDFCPDLLNPEIVKEMTNSDRGAVVTFDTSNLSQNPYFMNYDETEKYSEASDSHLQSQDSFRSSGPSTKVNIFRKSRCRVWITLVEDIDDVLYQCFKLIELDKDNELHTVKKSSSQKATKEQKENKQEIVALVDEKELDENQSILNEDGSSNPYDDDIRLIKDSRALVNEKKNPKAIKTLQKVFLVLMIICLASEIFLRVRRANNNETLSNYMYKYMSLFRRNILMTDVGYHLRKYEMIANKIVNNTDFGTLAEQKGIVLSKIKQIENEQIWCVVAHNEIYASKYQTNFTNTYTYLQTTGVYTKAVSNYLDAFYMLLTMAQLSVSADLIFMSRSEKIVQSLPQAKVAFERYLDNMYGANRLAGNEYTDRYRKIIEEFIAGAFLFGLIYYFCQLFMVIIAATILIKHVFDVMNKNKEVMTLFAMIEKEQIEKLKLECEDFRRNHLAEILEGDDNYMDSSRNILKQASLSPDEHIVKPIEPIIVEEEKLVIKNDKLSLRIPRNTSTGGGSQLHISSKKKKFNNTKESSTTPLGVGTPIVTIPLEDENFGSNPDIKFTGANLEPLNKNNNTTDPKTLKGLNYTSLQDEPGPNTIEASNKISLSRISNQNPPSATGSSQLELGIPPSNREPLVSNRLDSHRPEYMDTVMQTEAGRPLLTQSAAREPSRRARHMTMHYQDNNGRKGARKQKHDKKIMMPVQDLEVPEDVQHRIEILKGSKDSSKKAVLLKYFLAAISVCSIFTACMLYTFYNSQNEKKMIELIDTICHLSLQLSMSLFVFGEDLNRLTLIRSPTNTSLFYEMHDQTYGLGFRLTQAIQNMPFGFQDFEAHLRMVYFESVCKDLISRTQSTSYCNRDSVLMSGLELVNIKLLEFSKQNLDKISEGNDRWSPAAAAKVSELLNNEFVHTDKVFDAVSIVYAGIISSYETAFKEELSTRNLIYNLIFTMWIMIIFVGFAFIWLRYIQELSKSLWRIQGMLGMIPIDIVCSKPFMMAQFRGRILSKGIK